MFGFLKKLFPQKGESLEDLDDMYAEEEQKYEEEFPQIKKENRIEGLLPDLFRRFRRKKDEDSDMEMPEYALGPAEYEEDSAESSDTPGLLTKINNLEGVPKFAFLGIVTVLVVAGIYGGMHLFRGSGSHSPAGKKPAQVQQNAGIKTEENKKLPDNPMQVAGLPEGAPAGMENPFVETHAVATEIPASANQIVNPPPSMPVMSSSRALPSIPANPRPNLPASANMMPASAPTAAPAGNPMEVQGVITSSNESENVAIMGDGSIVSVGQTYKDGRIAFIGGDGITFEDGSKISMKP